ncbi:MAG TPA: hypothetical protein DCQ93_09800 [Bacteroidetes bacterium]|nr:hypothetical protein [Bacteroidota bacterium]
MSFARKFFLLIFLVQLIANHSYSQASRPNIVLFLTDDMNWKMVDKYSVDTFIHTPNIDRIANEGAEIKYYSTNSLCIPGRTSLLTGNYGHRTNVMTNLTRPDSSTVLITQRLHDAGYTVGLIGKWMVGNSNVRSDFDYWLWTPNKTTYYGDTAKYFNSFLPVAGHMTDLITDSAVNVISRLDTPFFLLISYNAPHYPWISQIQYDSLYQTDTFQLPGNWNIYSQNYPAGLYGGSGTYINGEAAYQSGMRDYNEMIAGVEVSIGKILDTLQAIGKIDSTMIIFTTDNGYLWGEHRLHGKQLPYDDCMRSPLFIRYPAWFSAGTIIDSTFALNIDLAPSILDAAGISDTSNMDGTSLRKIQTEDFKRNKFLYEQSPDDDSTAMVRTYRDNFFQYNLYYCTDTTEELFDMIEDPFQNNNLVHHWLYQDTLSIYRNKLDSMRIATNDTITAPYCNCSLSNPVYTYPTPVISFVITDETCSNQNGAVDVSIQSGTPPFTYQWNTGSTDEDAFGLIHGYYGLTVTDLHGNTASQVFHIINHITPTLSLSSTNATFSNNNGSINLTVYGFGTPFIYIWNNGASTQDLHNIFPGEYTVTVTNQYGCTVSASAQVNVIYYDTTLTDSYTSSADSQSFTTPDNIESVNNIEGIPFLFPNPASNEIEFLSIKNFLHFKIIDVLGRKIFEAPLPPEVNDYRLNTSGFQEGVYSIIFSNKNSKIYLPFIILR